jgi:Lon protease-like protein
MPEFDDIAFHPEDFSGTVRLFPLPKLVLFPRVMQPLHVFELRYRELLRDALGGDRLIAMATLAPGWETDYEGRPPLHPAICLGRIAACHGLDDGSSNLLLMGLRRARLVRELPPRRCYREAKVEVLEDQYPSEQASAGAGLRRRLCDAFLRLLPELPEIRDQADQLISSTVPLGVLTDGIGYALDLPVEQKQSLLAEPDVLRRARLLLDHLSCSHVEAVEDPSGLLAFPPSFSVN